MTEPRAHTPIELLALAERGRLYAERFPIFSEERTRMRTWADMCRAGACGDLSEIGAPAFVRQAAMRLKAAMEDPT